MRYKHDLHMPNATLIIYQKVYLYRNQVTVKCSPIQHYNLTL